MRGSWCSDSLGSVERDSRGARLAVSSGLDRSSLAFCHRANRFKPVKISTSRKRALSRA
jgi:hypothetical protein